MLIVCEGAAKSPQYSREGGLLGLFPLFWQLQHSQPGWAREQGRGERLCLPGARLWHGMGSAAAGRSQRDGSRLRCGGRVGTAFLLGLKVSVLHKI